jgi:hypothetical protein
MLSQAGQPINIESLPDSNFLHLSLSSLVVTISFHLHHVQLGLLAVYWQGQEAVQFQRLLLWI